jgi:O-antigen/teichoic acid export membrane protein
MERKNVAWNMIGSLIYAGSSMLLTALVNHIVGTNQGGIFGFAFSTFGQQMFLVAYFGLRPIQSTDVSGNYTFGEYRRARYLTCVAAIIMGIGYIAWKLAVSAPDYTLEKCLVVFLMVLYKVLDGFADVYESEFQRNGRLYLTGQAMAFRTILSVFCFLTSLVITKNLVFASGVAVVSQGAGILIFDKGMSRNMPTISVQKRKGKEWDILKDGGLLFLSVFLDGLIFAMAKYAVDSQMTSTDNAIFVAIFMPTSVINLAANFVVRPFLTKMSYLWEDKNLSGLVKEIRKLSGVILILTVIALAGAWVIGVPVLGAIYNVDLKPYLSGLLAIVFGGGLFAVMNLFYYVLVIMKQQKRIFFGYIPVCILSYFLSFSLVKVGGINGGAFSYLFAMLLLTLCFMGQAAYVLIKEKKGLIR